MSRSFPVLPAPFQGDEATGIHRGVPVAQFEIGNLRNFVYLILDWETKEAAVVDPQADLKPLLGALEQYGFKLTAVFVTHTHFDHIAGLPSLARQFADLKIYVHEDDARRFEGDYSDQKVSISDHQVLKVGSLEVEVLHTPGHSSGECSYLLRTEPPFVLTGDTVFIRDCGRTDFESGSNDQMFESIQRIKKLSPETIILPGHHYQREIASTVARELVESPPFRCQSVQELASLP